MIRLWLG